MVFFNGFLCAIESSRLPFLEGSGIQRSNSIPTLPTLSISTLSEQKVFQVGQRERPSHPQLPDASQKQHGIKP
jgi:hypothetical protein